MSTCYQCGSPSQEGHEQAGLEHCSPGCADETAELESEGQE